MKDEIRVELLKIATQLAQTAVQNKIMFGEVEKGLPDLESIFLRCLSSVKEQFKTVHN